MNVEVYLEAIRSGRGRMLAARAAGATIAQVEELARRDPEFFSAVIEAEMEAAESVEWSLYEAAISGNVTAMQMWLRHRVPDRWADARTLNVEYEASRQLRDLDRLIELRSADAGTTDTEAGSA